MSTAEFSRLLGDLRIMEHVNDGFLEYLEEARMVVPAARIHWPRSIVVEKHGGTPAVAVTPEEDAATHALDNALARWQRTGADPENEHPLDVIGPPATSLVVKNLQDLPFEAWQSFRTNIRGTGEAPLYTRAGVETLYHDWQAVLVADAAAMGVHVVMDTRREDLMRVAHELTRTLPPTGTRYYASIQYWAVEGLNRSAAWMPYFEAASRVEVARDRMLVAFSLTGSAYRELTTAERNDLERVLKMRAAQVLSSIPATLASVMKFLEYLCDRWAEWTRRGRAEIAVEYKRQLERGIRMARIAYGIDFKTIAADVGHVTGHAEPTLDVIFPDWANQAREKLELSLRHGVVRRAPVAGSLTLTDADVGDFSAWLDHRQHLDLLLSVEEMLKRQFSGNGVDRNALAKEASSLGLIVEQLVGGMLEDLAVTLPPKAGLMAKLLRFWIQDADMSAILNSYAAGQKPPSRSDRLVQIAGITHPSHKLELAKVLMRAVLYRNSGAHEGMAGWSEAELQSAIQDFLTALMFCRKQMILNPPQP